jgi:hypothetical protein
LGRTNSAPGNSPMDEVVKQLRSIVAAPEERPHRARLVAEAIRDARGYRWVGPYILRGSSVDGG